MPRKTKRKQKEVLVKFSARKEKQIGRFLKSRIGEDHYDLARARYSKDWVLHAGEVLQRKETKSQVAENKKRAAERDRIISSGEVGIKDVGRVLLQKFPRYKPRSEVDYIPIRAGSKKGWYRKRYADGTEKVVGKKAAAKGKRYEEEKRRINSLAGALDITTTEAASIRTDGRKRLRQKYEKLKKTKKWKNATARQRKKWSLTRRYRALDTLLQILATGGSNPTRI